MGASVEDGRERGVVSDLKRSCPACGTHSSDVGYDFINGDPCRFCGLPAEAALALDVAKARGAQQSILDMAAKAEARAGKAEAEVVRLRELLREILWAAERADRDE